MNKAVVILSGGLDSSTCLALAKSEGFAVHALTFSYGQRHAAELTAAKKVAASLNITEHKIFKVSLGELAQSALTDCTIDVPAHSKEIENIIPVTYVPGRNTVFLALALSYAETIGASAIYIGISNIDYSNYPDCRPEYLTAFQDLANLASKCGVEGRPIILKAPLLNLSKAATIKLAVSLGVDLSLTVSCYSLDDLGRACGVCSACFLRKEGFSAAGIPDSTRYFTYE